MKLTKNQLIEDGLQAFTNSLGDDIWVWFQPKTNKFCLELNCEVIKATKSLKPIQEKLNFLTSI